MTVYEISNSTQYQQANSTTTGAETTTHTYHFNGAAIVSETTTLPLVPAGEGGTGAASTSTVVFNTIGQPVWSQNADGAISYTGYSAATGAVVERIEDADVDDTATL